MVESLRQDLQKEKDKAMKLGKAAAAPAKKAAQKVVARARVVVSKKGKAPAKRRAADRAIQSFDEGRRQRNATGADVDEA